MNTLEALAEAMYKQYVIDNTDEKWTMPGWYLLPEHAKNKWYHKALKSGNAIIH